MDSGSGSDLREGGIKNDYLQDKFHDDEYENGELVELRKVDMVGDICVGCDEERRDNEEFERANAPDFD